MCDMSAGATPSAVHDCSDMDERELKRKLADTAREFVYLKRQLPPEVAAKRRAARACPASR